LNTLSTVLCEMTLTIIILLVGYRQAHLLFPHQFFSPACELRRFFHHS
jgi:hypothetical protein